MKKLQLLVAITLFMAIQQINASADDRDRFHTALATSIQFRRTGQVDRLVSCQLSTAISEAQLTRWREEFRNLPGNQNIFQQLITIITVEPEHQKIMEIRTFTIQDVNEKIREFRERQAAQAQPRP